MMKVSMAPSDEETDDLPLKYMSSSYNQYNCLLALKKYSIHACDICEEVFENRYDYFVHNSKHIIIPLIKILPHYCSQCDEYCASKEEMDDHMSDKHVDLAENKSNIDNKTSIINKIKLEEELVEEEDDLPLISCITSNNEILRNHTRNGVEDNILSNLVKNFIVDVEKFEPWLTPSTKKIDKNNHFKTDGSKSNIRDGLKPYVKETETVVCDADILENSLEELETSSHHKVSNNSFNNYFVTKTCEKQNRDDFISQIEEFRPSTALERVIEDNESEFKNFPAEFEPFTSLHSAINGGVDHFKITVDNGDSDSSDLDEDPIVILGPIKRDLIGDSIRKTGDSVHFDDLVKPGTVRCKRCSKGFPNRFSMIVHESVHMDLSKAFTTFRGNHMNPPSANSVTDSSGIVQPLKRSTCHQCLRETTNLDMHLQTCPASYCDQCGKCCPNNQALATHKLSCRERFETYLCDSCLYFRERPKHIHYTGIKRLDESTVKQCHWCGKVSKGTSLVTCKPTKRGKKGMKAKLADRIAFECGPKGGGGAASKPASELTAGQAKGKCQKKGLSNQERLKLIQQRFKLMKK